MKDKGINKILKTYLVETLSYCNAERSNFVFNSYVKAIFKSNFYPFDLLCYRYAFEGARNDFLEILSVVKEVLWTIGLVDKFIRLKTVIKSGFGGYCLFRVLLL